MYKHLYDNFKHWYRGGQIWFYSDPHFADEEMKCIRKNYIGDEEQIKQINSVLGKKDTLVILGDVGDIDCVRKLKGYKVLIMGNHDAGASNYQKKDLSLKYSVDEYTEGEAIAAVKKRYPKWKILSVGKYYDTVRSPFVYWGIELTNNLFDEVYEGALIIGEKLILSHEPVNYPYAINIHGHNHYGTSDATHINMCAECIDYKPVCLKTIVNSGILKNVQTIHRETIDRASGRSEYPGKWAFVKYRGDAEIYAVCQHCGFTYPSSVRRLYEGKLQMPEPSIDNLYSYCPKCGLRMGVYNGEYVYHQDANLKDFY